MRFAWLMLLSAVTVAPVRAQHSVFSLSHSPCVIEHDPAVEKALQVVAIKPGGRNLVELRNASAKPITAYVLMYTVTRGKNTHYYPAQGSDFADELSNFALLPGQTYQAEIWGGKAPARIEVYPCLVVFDDRTGVGPPELLAHLMSVRQRRAEVLETMIRELEAARSADDPKADLILRAKRTPRTVTSRGPGNTHITTNITARRYLEEIAGRLSGTRNSDQKLLTDEISEHRTQQQALLKQIAVPQK